ncbi:MAG: FAD-dependent oxidoreductase [Bacilli bacterium]|nr:FAD-dependent oxidoreductase [Bacilli bacterium]
MEKKSICVIGGGIGGITTANKLLRYGYKVSLYEKNPYLGGLCSGYSVDGYHIDACFHWLMGAKKNTKIYKVWKDLGGLNNSVQIFHSGTFLTIDNNGEIIHLYADLDKSRDEWTKLSPNDEVNIRRFFGTVEKLKIFWDYSQTNKKKRRELLQLFSEISMKIKGVQGSRDDFSKCFGNETIRLAIRYGLTGYNNTLFFMIAYAAYSAGDSGVPFGGAEEIIKRVHDKLINLGCDIHLNEPVDEIVVADGKAVGIVSNGKFTQYDTIVSCVDPNFTIKELLKNKYKIKFFNKLKKNVKDNPVSSCFVTYLAANKKLLENIEVPTIINIDPINVGKKNMDAMLVRPYYFDPYFDKGKDSVVSLFFDQNQDDYNFYKKMSDAEYHKYKNNLIKESQKIFENRYPFLKGKTKVLTSFGPLELYKQTYTSFGAIQSYSFTEESGFKSFSGKSKAISNLYFATQWNKSVGGTPTAIQSGVKVAKKINRSYKNPIKRIAKKLSFKD